MIQFKEMKFLRQLKKKDLVGKICLLRTDFNVKNVSDSLRLERSLPTIKFLLKNSARVVLLSHRGRPQSNNKQHRTRDKEVFSLKLLKPFLESELKQSLFF